jgi:hypothetical protein
MIQKQQTIKQNSDEVQFENQFEKQMTKTILEYETMLGQDNYFKSESDKKETELLLNTLKT